MRTWRLFRQSMTALGRNKLRSFLVMLGVIVGIGALTVVVSIANAADRKVMRRVNTFGPTSIMVFAGGGKNVPGADVSVTTLTLEDAKAIEQQVPGIRLASPMLSRSRIPVSYQDRASEVTVIGAPLNWPESWDWQIAEGEFFDDQDMTGVARVAVIGQTAARELFQGANPIGETIRLANATYKIKGILASKGTSPMGGDMDDRVIIPLTTAMRRTFNATFISAVRVRAGSASQVERVASEIRALMRERHHIRPPDQDDFRVVTPGAIAVLAQVVSGTLNKVLLAVTALSLLVGGIVLMNVMLLAVTERRREIGLRRALGGRRLDLLLQFLFEAVALTSTGGAIGALIGIAVVLAMGKWNPGQAVLSWEPIVLALVISFVVGLAFGLLPARRAARLHPVEALR